MPKNKTVRLIPSQVPQTINLLWRTQTRSLAPANFQKVFGKRSLLIDDVKNIALDWSEQKFETPEAELSWFEGALKRYDAPENDGVIDERIAAKKAERSARPKIEWEEELDDA